MHLLFEQLDNLNKIAKDTAMDVEKLKKVEQEFNRWLYGQDIRRFDTKDIQWKPVREIKWSRRQPLKKIVVATYNKIV